MELLQGLDFSKLKYNEDNQARALYFRKVEALLRLDREDEVINMLMNPPFEIERPKFINERLMSLAKLKAYDELEQVLQYHTATMSTEKQPLHYSRGYSIIGLLASDDVEKATVETKAYLKALETEKDTRPGPPGMSLQEVQLFLSLAIGETEYAKAFLEAGVGLDESRAEVLSLKGIYFAQIKETTAAREVINQLEKLKSPYDYGNLEMQKAVIETWLGNHDTAISLLLSARQKSRALSFNLFDGDWRLKPLFDHPDFKEKVMASIPLPAIENTSSLHYTNAASPNQAWLSILLLLLSGITAFFAQRTFRKIDKYKSVQPSPAVG